MHLVGAGAGAQCFPFYVLPDGPEHPQENITDWALNHFRTHYGDSAITKWDIFHYVYGILHHPGYRSRFADNFKRELPRIPLAPNFRSFAQAGKKLADFHLDYETVDPYVLEWVPTPGVPFTTRVQDKMRLDQTRTELIVNPSLTLKGIPAEVFDYRLGNRSALEWIMDQYQVTTDPRSGIHSDPNDYAGDDYVVRLVERIIRVSIDTVRIIGTLPAPWA